MRMVRTWLLCVVASLAVATAASAQTTTSTISGRVADSQGLALPGVTVSATSPNLQGTRVVTTSTNGDYVFTLLPSGTYTILFELSGFQRQERNVTLAPTQTLPLDVSMGVAGVSETVEVVGQSNLATQTSQVASNFRQDMISTLPTNRDLNASMLLAPSVTPTGPSGAFSIAGSMSFETNFMVNGVVVNDNLRGTANTLYIEDAVQETNVMTSGVSAEFGRFQGGVVNVVTKSGGNLFSGSFRDTLNNDNWRALTPCDLSDEQHAEDRQDGAGVRVRGRRPGGEGSAVVLHGRPSAGSEDHQHHRGADQPALHQSSTTTRNASIGEGNVFVQLEPHVPGQLHEDIINDQIGDHFGNVMDLRSLDNRQLPQDLFSINYNGIITPKFFVEDPGLRASLQLRRVRRADDRPDSRDARHRSVAQRHPILVADLLRHL